MPEYRRLENGLCAATWRRWEGKGSTPAEALEGLLNVMAEQIEHPLVQAQPEVVRWPESTPIVLPSELRSMLGAR